MANTLEIVIKATDKASKEISSVTKGIDGLGKAGGAIFKTVSIAAAAAATAVGAVGAAIVKLAVDAVPLQGIEAAFQGITEGSAEMLDALRASSNGMVRDTELMKSYNLAAQLVGKEFADKLPDAMGYLQKVAAATGQDMSYMMDSLVRGVGRMSPMILDNLGIQVTLEEATAEAAAMFGVEASELTKVQLQAGMTNVVMRALERNTASMPEVAGSAAQQWAAFNTQLANFKDRIGMGALPVLQRVLGTLESAGLSSWLEKISNWFSDSFVPGLLDAWDRIAQFFEDLSNGERLATAVRKMLQGVFGEDTVQKAVDIALWVDALVRAVKAGNWSKVGSMLWEQVTTAFNKASASMDVTAGKANDFLRHMIGNMLGLIEDAEIPAGMEGLPSNVLAQFQKNDPTWGEIGVAIAEQLQQALLSASVALKAWVGGAGYEKLGQVGYAIGDTIAKGIMTIFGLNTETVDATGGHINVTMWQVENNLHDSMVVIGQQLGTAVLEGMWAAFHGGQTWDENMIEIEADAKAFSDSWWGSFMYKWGQSYGSWVASLPDWMQKWFGGGEAAVAPSGIPGFSPNISSIPNVDSGGYEGTRGASIMPNLLGSATAITVQGRRQMDSSIDNTPYSGIRADAPARNERYDWATSDEPAAEILRRFLMAAATGSTGPLISLTFNGPTNKDDVQIGVMQGLRAAGVMY